jgi:hypothetical protein
MSREFFPRVRAFGPWVKIIVYNTSIYHSQHRRIDRTSETVIFDTHTHVSVKRGNRSAIARDLILLNGLLHHPAVQVRTNLDDRTGLIKAHAPGVRVVEFQS